MFLPACFENSRATWLQNEASTQAHVQTPGVRTTSSSRGRNCCEAFEHINTRETHANAAAAFFFTARGSSLWLVKPSSLSAALLILNQVSACSLALQTYSRHSAAMGCAASVQTEQVAKRTAPSSEGCLSFCKPPATQALSERR